MTHAVIDRLSRDDARILRLGRDTIRGHTCKVIVLERAADAPELTLEALQARLVARLDRAPRFRKRLRETPLRVATPVWVDDLNFDIGRHVTLLRAPADSPADVSDLQRLVAARMSDRLDRSHPLWHIDLVPSLADGTSALIWRVHHCVADGTTSMRLASDLLWDREDGDAPAAGGADAWQPAPPPGAPRLLSAGLAARAGAWRHDFRRPSVDLAGLREFRDVARRELRRTASVTPLAGRAGPTRAVAFARASLEECRRAGKAIDAAITVNDVVLALVAGGVRAWLAAHSRADDAIRVKVPVSLHHAGEAPTVGNRDSYFFVDLPVDEPDPVERVLAINRETRERKLHHDAETLYRLGTHPAVARWAMSPRVFTFNVSNVPGPPAPVSIFGAGVRELYSLAEIAQGHALRVAIISASGTLFFGFCADRDAVPDVGCVADGVADAMAELTPGSRAGSPAA